MGCGPGVDQAPHQAKPRSEVTQFSTALSTRLLRRPFTTAFTEDEEHASYDRDAVRRFWRILDWNDIVFEEFSGWFCGKSSPVQLYWHGLDLAFARFSGVRAPTRPDADPVSQEAYSHEVIASGSGQTISTRRSRATTRTPRPSPTVFGRRSSPHWRYGASEMVDRGDTARVPTVRVRGWGGCRRWDTATLEWSWWSPRPKSFRFSADPLLRGFAPSDARAGNRHRSCTGSPCILGSQKG